MRVCVSVCKLGKKGEECGGEQGNGKESDNVKGGMIEVRVVGRYLRPRSRCQDS